MAISTKIFIGGVRSLIVASPTKNCAIVLYFSGFMIMLLSPGVASFFTVSPLKLINYFRIWTLVTFWVFESNIIMLLNHIICIHLTFTILKTSWSLRELVNFFCFTNLLTAAVTCSFMIAIYVATSAEDFYFTDKLAIRGVTGYDAAVLVASVQNMPDTAIFTLPFGRYKNSHVPFTWIIVALVLWLLDLLNLIHVLMFAVGFYVSWCYLRFYQKHSNGSIGDSSACFSFHSFFPSILQPFVERTGKLTYRILIKLRICKPVIRSFDVKQLQSVITATPTIVDSVDRERRKQKALKDLSERLAKTKEEGLLPWDEQATDPNSANELNTNSALENQIGLGQKSSTILNEESPSAQSVSDR